MTEVELVMTDNDLTTDSCGYSDSHLPSSLSTGGFDEVDDVVGEEAA